MHWLHFIFVKLECNPKYKDKDGFACDAYSKNNWCTQTGGQGPAWDPDYPSIDDYYNANGETPLVCPQCGCNKGKKLLNICIVLLGIDHLHHSKWICLIRNFFNA